ncbi:MAG TPA: ATP-binding protein, partial [Burkholderiaceae bacterium]|nr:ATP-binding protein [Burkholderiaceae bacterium]
EQFNESAETAVRAMEIARRSNDPLAMTYAHQGMAIAFFQGQHREQTKQHYERMRAYAQAARSKLLEAFAIGGLSAIALQVGDPVLAEQLGRDAVTKYREVGAPFAIGFGLYAVADTLRLQKRHVEAIAALDEAIEVYRQYPNPIGLWFALNGRSADLEALGDLARAESDANRADAIAKELNVAIYTSGSARRLASLAAARKDYQRAYELTASAVEMTTRATGEKAAARMVELIQRYESEGKQREIDELTHRNEQQAAELQQRELRQRWLWTLLGTALLVLLATAGLVARLRRTQRKLHLLNRELQRSDNEIRQLNTGLEQRVQARTAELRQQARYLRTLIDMLPMWAWFKDTRSRYLVVNDAHAQARGHTPDAMEGHSDPELLPDELARKQLADDAEVMRSRGRKIAEERIDDAGRPVWMETYRAPVIDEDGTVLGTVGVAQNISERKATEAAREAALAEATRLARQRSDFLAQMSHELRTPLNGIIGFAQILQGDRQLTEAQARGLKIIDESGQHLLTLINDILDLARIDAAKLELYLTDVDLPGLLQAVCDIVRIKADEKRLTFRYRPCAGLPATVRADDKRLRQVLLNLLSNAVKFTDAGTVGLSVTCAPLPPSTTAPQTRLRFEIEDDGIGMSETQLRQLFQPFEQVGEGKRRVGGTGLGLAISQQLIGLMGGEIHVHSQPGAGSTFWFEIDVAAPASAPARAAPGREIVVGYEGRRRRILVVDDTAANRAMLVEALTQLDFEVAQAADGQEALEAADRLVPDLILMDLTMPVMDGLEATQRLRLLPAHACVPIIATSASAGPGVTTQSRAAGANAFIGKPINHAELLLLIGELLGLSWIREGTGAGRTAEGVAA